MVSTPSSDRDFALDLSYAAARCQLHASRVAADMIDFASSEFGFVKLSDRIACGSSLMPQKKNPDLFELIRGKAGRSIGNLMQLFVILRGLPTGYQRDLQEDRASVLGAGADDVVLEALAHRAGRDRLRRRAGRRSSRPNRCRRWMSPRAS